MPIILPLGRTVKAYLRLYGTRCPVLKFSCPICEHPVMHAHGKYQRTAVTGRKVYTVPIYRWRCAGCSMTTAVLPDLLAPYAQFVSVVREGVLRRHLRGWTVGKIAACTCQSGAGGLAERTVARWLSQIRRCAQAWVAALSEQLLRLRPGWDLFARRWAGANALVQALCDLGDACCALTGNDHRHRGVYAYCNSLFPALPRL
jgi:hypothetical protein